jgi:antitoxin Phd
MASFTADRVQIWQVHEAKAKFSELLDTCLRDGPQLITKHRADVAVLMPVAEWRRLQNAARTSLKELLLAAEPRFDLPLPPRGKSRHREPPKLT